MRSFHHSIRRLLTAVDEVHPSTSAKAPHSLSPPHSLAGTLTSIFLLSQKSGSSHYSLASIFNIFPSSDFSSTINTCLNISYRNKNSYFPTAHTASRPIASFQHIQPATRYPCLDAHKHLKTDTSKTELAILLVLRTRFFPVSVNYPPSSQPPKLYTGHHPHPPHLVSCQILSSVGHRRLFISLHPPCPNHSSSHCPLLL